LTPALLPLFSDRIVYTSALHLPDSIEPAEWDFVPRFGFAFAATKNTVLRGAYGIYQLFTDLGSINNEVATVPFVAAVTIVNDRPPFKPTRTWGDYFLGQPNVAPNPNPGAQCAFGFVANSCATPNMQANEIKSKNQYAQQWTVALQHQFGSAISLDVTYVGTKTTHLQKLPSINDPAPGPGAIQTRRPYSQWGQMLYNTFSGFANYNALQAKVETRELEGLTVLGSYTYSRCLDSATGFTSAYQPHSYAACDYDFPQDFTGSFNYALPYGAGKRWTGNGIANAVSGMSLTGICIDNGIFGNYQMAGVLTARNGAPFTPTISTDRANTGVGNQWPTRVSAPKVIGNPSCWFYVSANTGCAAVAPSQQPAFAMPAQYTYGNDGRNVLRAGNVVQLDMTLLKQIKFLESRMLELRFESFNLLNHPSFAAPTTTINTGSGGQVSSTINSSRILQASAKIFF
jgi:hypothetical protein